MRLEFDMAAFSAKVNGRRKAAQIWLDNTVMRDTDRFVKFRSGTLARSVQIATRAGSGEVVYDTPYAQAAYYSHGVPNRNTHRDATRLWFEESKRRNLSSWMDGVERILKEGNA